MYVCVCPVFLCLWLSGEPRGGLKTESLAFSCCHFSVSPFAFCSLSQGLGTGLSVPVCPAPLMLPAPNGHRSARDGCHPSKVCWGSGQAPSQGCPLDPAPTAGTSRPAWVRVPPPGTLRARPERISGLPGAFPSSSSSFP